MNENLNKLFRIASKPSRNIIGLMSGTSLDGLDIAFCVVTGSGLDTRVKMSHFKTVPYSHELKEDIRCVFAKKVGDIEHLTLLHPRLGQLHGQWILDSLTEWGIQPNEVDLIASHGQTVYHAPKINRTPDRFGNATLQVGDGDHLASTTGIITISDFRQKHLAAGGEGAPLALYGDYLLFSSSSENRLLLNMGGIANFTYLPRSLQTDKVFVTDTGPGNTLMDSWTNLVFQLAFDKDGKLALQGHVNHDLLRALKKHSFFNLPIPKTTGPEVFSIEYLMDAQRASSTLEISPYDVLATLAKFSAETIVDALKRLPDYNLIDKIYVSGGGANNPHLISLIKTDIPHIQMERTESLGIPGDAKEAVLFAVLANEAVAGNPIEFGSRSELPSVTMGKFSFPV